MKTRVDGVLIGEAAEVNVITDPTVAVTIGKRSRPDQLEVRLSMKAGPLKPKGVWNADTNSPTLTSGVGADGDSYLVSVAGTTDLDGEDDWNGGDLAYFFDGAWHKIDNSEKPQTDDNSVFVDKTFGDDATGARERRDLPFKTCTAAKAVAISGDTIFPNGIFDENNLAKNGVNWHFEAGSGVVYETNNVTASLDGLAIFDDYTDDTFGATTAKSYSVTGYGTFKSIAPAGYGVVEAANAASKVYFEAAPVDWTPASGVYSVFGECDGGDLTISIPKIRKDESASGIAAVLFYQIGGTMRVNVRDVALVSDGTNSNAIFFVGKGTFDFQVGRVSGTGGTSRLLEVGGSGTGAVNGTLRCDGGVADAALTVNDPATGTVSLDLRNFSAATTNLISDTTTAGGLTVNVDVDSVSTAGALVDYKEADVNIRGITVSVTGYAALCRGTGTLTVDVPRVDCGLYVRVFDGFSGKVLWRGDVIASGNDAGVINLASNDGGRVEFVESRIESGGSNQPSVNIAAGNTTVLVLRDCVLITNGSGKAIDAADAQTVQTLSVYANADLDADVTYVGDFFFSSSIT
jgi:hypothetical protein